MPHSSRLHRHTAARPGKNLRAGSTRVSTHRCGGSCTTGCARCGWWTWPSLLRLGATSRRALRRGLAAMELREQESLRFLLFQLPTETKKFDRPIFLSPFLSPTKVLQHVGFTTAPIALVEAGSTRTRWCLTCSRCTPFCVRVVCVFHVWFCWFSPFRHKVLSSRRPCAPSEEFRGFLLRGGRF